METKFDDIAQQAQNQLPKIDAPVQAIKDAVQQCEKWLEGSEPVMEQLRSLKVSDYERESIKKHLMLLAAILGRWSLVRQLLQNDADPNCVHKSSLLTPLHLAALRGHVSTLQTLLTSPSIEVNATDAAGNTPLMCAAQSGYHALVVHLLNHSADPKAVNKDGYTAHDFALAYGHCKVLHQLLERYNPLTEARLKEKIIFYKICCFEASKNSWLEILKVLVRCGMPMDVKLESGSDLVLTSCAYIQVEVLKFLVEQQVSLDQPDNEGTRPLFHACYNGSIDMVRLLCAGGAHVNLQDARGRSPAYMAAAGGHLDVLQHLEELNCDLGAVTKSGESLLDAAINGGCLELFNHLWNRYAETAMSSQKLLAHRAARKLQAKILESILTRRPELLEQEDCDGSTPLLSACQRRCQEVLELLRLRKANFSHANRKGRTPALCLASFGNPELLQIVLDAGGRLDQPNWKGDTPFLVTSRCNNLEVAEFLSRHDCKLNSVNYNGHTAAYYAAGQKSSDLLRFLLDKNVQLDEETVDGMTPLLQAAKEDRLESAQLLLESECDVEHVNKEGQNIASFSALNGSVEMLTLAIKHKADLHARERSGNTPVINACLRGHLEVLKILKKEDCHLDAKNYKNQSGLHFAAQNGSVEVAKFLLESGVNCDARDAEGNTPLILAAYAGHEEVLQLLYKHECDVHLHNEEGRDALHYACMGNQPRCVQLLQTMGSNLIQTDSAGVTPLMLACKCDTGDRIESIQILETLYSTDFDQLVHFQDCNLQSCAHYAAETGNYAALKLLHRHGLKMDEPNRDGETPLILAAKGRFRKSVEFLLTECNASVTAVDCNGQSPVHKAAICGHLPVVQLLETRGASMDTADKAGMTPIMLAASQGNVSVVGFLQEKRCLDTKKCPGSDENIVHLAAKGGHNPIIERLIDRQDLTSALTVLGDSCLSLLLQQRDSPHVAEALSEIINLESVNSDGLTVLLIAAKFGRECTLKVLLNLTCNRNATDSNGNSALMLAAQEGHNKCVRLLLDSDLNHRSRNKLGKTALHLCCAKGSRLCADLLSDADSKTVDEEKLINWQDNDGNTALMLAIQKGCFGLVRTLLRNGAHWASSNKRGDTAWTLAFKSHRLDILNLLEDAGHPSVTPQLLQDACKRTNDKFLVLDAFQSALLANKPAFVDKFLPCFEGNMADLIGPCSDGSYLLHACSHSNLMSTAKKLLDGGADIDCRDKQRQTPFLRAVIENRVNMAMTLFNKCCKVFDATDSNGRDALMMATINRSHVLIEWLLSKEMKIDRQDRDGYTALHFAAKLGSRRIFARLLSASTEEVAGIEERRNGHTIAHIAACEGNGRILMEIGHSTHRRLLEIVPKRPSVFGLACSRGWNNVVRKLIAMKFSPPAARMTNYIAAACAGGHLQVLIDLLKEDDVVLSRIIFQAAGRYGRLAVVAHLLSHYLERYPECVSDMLAAAVAHGHQNIVCYMMTQGIPADRLDDKGNMPCHIAAIRGHDHLLKLIVSIIYNENLSIVALNKRKRNLLHLACINGHERVVELLLAKSIEINAADEFGNTALLYASSQGSQSIVRRLLEHGAEPNTSGGPKNTTSVHTACQLGYLDVLDALNQYGAKLDALDADNSTGLMMAAARGHEKIVEYLLQRGCNPDAVNQDGASAVQLAIRGRHSKVLAVFLRNNLLTPEGLTRQSNIGPDQIGSPILCCDQQADVDSMKYYDSLGLCDSETVDSDAEDAAEGYNDTGADDFTSVQMVDPVGGCNTREILSILESAPRQDDILSGLADRSNNTCASAWLFPHEEANEAQGNRNDPNPGLLMSCGRGEKPTDYWQLDKRQNERGEWLVKKTLVWKDSLDSSKTFDSLKRLQEKLYKLKRRCLLQMTQAIPEAQRHLLWPVDYEIKDRNIIEVSITYRYIDWHLPQLLAQRYKEDNGGQELRLTDVEFQKSIVCGVLSGLKVLHKIGLVHGCLTLNSVYVTSNKQVMLKGFDSLHDLLAERMQPTRDRRLRDAHTKAPELFRDRSVPTQQSDMWSMGILVYQLVTGQTPMADKYDSEVKDYYTRGNSARLPTMIHLNNPQLQAVINGCLHIDPNSRKSADDLLKMLPPQLPARTACRSFRVSEGETDSAE